MRTKATLAPKVGDFPETHTLSPKYHPCEGRLRAMAKQYARTDSGSNEAFDMLASFKYLPQDDKERLKVMVIEEEQLID